MFLVTNTGTVPLLVLTNKYMIPYMCIYLSFYVLCVYVLPMYVYVLYVLYVHIYGRTYLALLCSTFICDVLAVTLSRVVLIIPRHRNYLIAHYLLVVILLRSNGDTGVPARQLYPILYYHPS